LAESFKVLLMLTRHACSHPFTNVRPYMRQVVPYLNGNMPLLEQLTLADMSFNMLSLI
jgi:hypothetical protein